jgi:hypothetical protein
MIDDRITRIGSGDAGGSRVPSKQWHCRVNGQVYGPISTEQLLRWAQERRLSPTDSIEAGDAKWFPAATVQGLFSEAESARALEQIAAEKAAASEKAATANSAEDIIRKMRPDLYAHKHAGGLGAGRSDDLESRGGGRPSAEVAEVHVATKQKKEKKPKKERSAVFQFSLLDSVREIPYSLTDGLRSFVGWVADHIPRWMTRWTILHTLVVAVAAIGTGVYIALAMNPETNPDQYIYDELTAIYDEYRAHLDGQVSGDIEAFRADAIERVDDVIHDLEKTTDVYGRQRQHLRWAAQSNLKPFLLDQDARDKESDFKRHMAEVKRVWSDNERRERMRKRLRQQ